ncbi:Uncharacterised protein [Segatella copri]|nr:Uncharacterised protein [Segatella copri]
MPPNIKLFSDFFAALTFAIRFASSSIPVSLAIVWYELALRMMMRRVAISSLEHSLKINSVCLLTHLESSISFFVLSE